MRVFFKKVSIKIRAEFPSMNLFVFESYSIKRVLTFDITHCLFIILTRLTILQWKREFNGINRIAVKDAKWLNLSRYTIRLEGGGRGGIYADCKNKINSVLILPVRPFVYPVSTIYIFS